MSKLEKCPTCKQMKVCSQIFLDGLKNYIGYGCEDCHAKEITKAYSKEDAEAVLGILNRLEKESIKQDERNN